jgi:hypothetical protein
VLLGDDLIWLKRFVETFEAPDVAAAVAGTPTKAVATVGRRPA